MSIEKSWAEKIKDTGFDFEKSGELMREAVQDYTNKICYALSPINPMDRIFILAALKSVTNNLAGTDPKADKMSEMLMRMFSVGRVSMSVSADIPLDELVRMKDSFFEWNSNMKTQEGKR